MNKKEQETIKDNFDYWLDENQIIIDALIARIKFLEKENKLLYTINENSYNLTKENRELKKKIREIHRKESK
jgi:hypothetical protein